MDAQAQSGCIIWFTGMRGAGKSALSRHLYQRLGLAGRRAELIDADDPAEILTQGLGESKEDRNVAIRRVGHVAKMLSRSGAVALCASLSPYREPREALRREARRFIEVFVDCPMETLLEREPVYRKAMAGEVRNVPGIDDPYEPPQHAELTVHSDREAVADAAARILQILLDLKYITPNEFERISGGVRARYSRPAKKKSARKAAARKVPLSRKAPKKIAARTASKVRAAGRASRRPTRHR